VALAAWPVQHKKKMVIAIIEKETVDAASVSRRVEKEDV
jgi:hypothetical protein